MRSGTTLLRLMLNESPDMSIPAESHFVARLVKTFAPGHELSDAERQWAVDFIISRPEWQRDFTTTDDELRAAVLAESGATTLEQLLDRVFRAEIASTGKPRWGDKTPAYLYFADRILAHFPAAQVVAIVRDPRDVFLSLRQYDWVGRTTWSIGSYLQKCGNLVNRWSQDFDASRFVVVRYENLVLDTEDTLRQLCDTLALEFDQGMLSFFESADDNVQDWEFDIGAHTKLRRNVRATDVSRWKREGDPGQIAEVESLTTSVIQRYGYESAVPRWRAPVLRARARFRYRQSQRRSDGSGSGTDNE